MPKIWIINQHANTPNMPGHTRQYEVANGLSQKGWNIELFASDYNISTRKFFFLKNNQISISQRIKNITWHWLYAYPYKRNNWKRIFNIFSFSFHLFWRLFFKLVKDKFTKEIPDIVLASSPQLPAAFVGFIFAKLIRKPFVIEIRDLWPQVLIEQGGKSEKNLIIKLLLFMEKVIYQNASYVIVLAKGSCDFVAKRGAKNVAWLPNGPDLKIFRQKNYPPEPKKFSFEYPFKIFYTGAHGDANALNVIIDAARLLINLPIKIIFVGDGPEKQKLIQCSNGLKNISFQDSVPKKDIPDLLKDAHAIILTLKGVKLFSYGVSPNKLYDAYAIGRPVITNVSGDINDEVNDNRLGFTAESDNPQELSEAIRKLFFTDRSERVLMSNRARKLAETIYSREKIIYKYNRLLNELIE